MTELVELSNSEHGTLKVTDNAAVVFVKQQHILTIRVKEITQAISSFPVFLVKNPHTGLWNIAALSSFEMGQNLFVRDDKWHAIFTPTSMQTFPFFLMNLAGENQGYTMGIAPNDLAFSTIEGQSIFESTGKPSLLLSRVKTLLEADIKNDIQSYQFAEKLEAMQLIKRINLVVQYADGTVKTLKGMNSIDEAKLQQLTNDELAGLNKLGYLMPIHAMLMSIIQLNNLIQKHNNVESNKTISQVKLALE
ncbi:SapC family protein [Colwellia sp. C1TZA3]|uniref:SapC family protein n=1 Tax=Colwellia sp. C1TZA3 TaxID=2508879 RepID=UPI0011B9E1E1|nr:SapC family protein [Colwellia sp. C1TZA3]TWX72452.1 SapC family protein [Colwellia sp. C1TZA3]